MRVLEHFRSTIICIFYSSSCSVQIIRVIYSWAVSLLVAAVFGEDAGVWKLVASSTYSNWALAFSGCNRSAWSRYVRWTGSDDAELKDDDTIGQQQQHMTSSSPSPSLCTNIHHHQQQQVYIPTILTVTWSTGVTAPRLTSSQLCPASVDMTVCRLWPSGQRVQCPDVSTSICMHLRCDMLLS